LCFRKVRPNGSRDLDRHFEDALDDDVAERAAVTGSWPAIPATSESPE
jgi:hypothetical protein